MAREEHDQLLLPCCPRWTPTLCLSLFYICSLLDKPTTPRPPPPSSPLGTPGLSLTLSTDSVGARQILVVKVDDWHSRHGLGLDRLKAASSLDLRDVTRSVDSLRARALEEYLKADLARQKRPESQRRWAGPSPHPARRD